MGEISPFNLAEVCGEVLKSSEFTDNSWEQPRAKVPTSFAKKDALWFRP